MNVRFVSFIDTSFDFIHQFSGSSVIQGVTERIFVPDVG
ncbi:hypothetical protein ROS217_06525 [Roseovarius sp. 217]|nr:hypothetical protein ROS217_06525 [Roseovarius sp. 217]